MFDPSASMTGFGRLCLLGAGVVVATGLIAGCGDSTSSEPTGGSDGSDLEIEVEIPAPGEDSGSDSGSTDAELQQEIRELEQEMEELESESGFN